MMFHRNLKSVFSVVAAFVLLACSLYVSAEKNDGTITVASEKAATGDSVIISFTIEDNPGIMAMTLSITYDSKALTYQKYYKGFFKDYTVADHPDRGLVRMVNCETYDRKNNGKMFSLQFKVNDDAEFDFHKITIDYQSGDFCNWYLDKLMPKIIPGGVDIAFNGNNCSHKKYGEWETAADASCLEPGAQQRFCEKCGHVDIKETPALGHDFEDKWTLDRAATADSPGSMSRHCKRCDETTDVLSFTLEESEELQINNTVGAEIAPSKNTEQMMQEQHPESLEENKDLTESESETGSENETAVDKIVSVTGGSKTGRLAKILSAIPDVKTVGIIALTLMSVLLRLIVI